jgi:hypothetical protein
VSNLRGWVALSSKHSLRRSRDSLREMPFKCYSHLTRIRSKFCDRTLLHATCQDHGAQKMMSRTFYIEYRPPKWCPLATAPSHSETQRRNLLACCLTILNRRNGESRLPVPFIQSPHVNNKDRTFQRLFTFTSRPAHADDPTPRTPST